jgi:predicted ATP-dependent endonuclease of OLD family
MLKIAFFVEGQSERIFLESFIGEYLAPTDRILRSFQIVGEKLRTITKGINYETPSYYFVIYDVGCDES